MTRSRFIVAIAFVLFANSTFAQSPRLIVRGDDMGFSHAGNEALIKCYQTGIEKSIEIIVPSPWFPEAVKLLKQNPAVDVGVHIALTSEWDNVKYRPLTECPSLVDADGYFYPFIWKNDNYPGRALLENNWSLKEIEQEMRAQIALAVRHIPNVSHISAHMGCYYMNDDVRGIAKRLAQEFKIDIDEADHGVKFVTYIGPKKTSNEKIESFIKMLESLKPGGTYLFVDHPGLNTPELQAIYHIGYEDVAADRQGVTDTWTDKRVMDAIKRLNISLISYADLRKGK